MEETEDRPQGQAPPRWEFGAQVMWEAAPDVLRLSLVGTIDGPELAAIFAAQLAWAQGKTHWFSIVDVSRFVTSTPSARSVVFAQAADPTAITILIGLTFGTRMLIELTLRAMRLLKPESVHDFLVAATEAEAWSEVARIRAKMGGRANGH